MVGHQFSLIQLRRQAFNDSQLQTNRQTNTMRSNLLVVLCLVALFMAVDVMAGGGTRDANGNHKAGSGMVRSKAVHKGLSDLGAGQGSEQGTGKIIEKK